MFMQSMLSDYWDERASVSVEIFRFFSPRNFHGEFARRRKKERFLRLSEVSLGSFGRCPRVLLFSIFKPENLRNFHPHVFSGKTFDTINYSVRERASGMFGKEQVFCEVCSTWSEHRIFVVLNFQLDWTQTNNLELFSVLRFLSRWLSIYRH